MFDVLCVVGIIYFDMVYVYIDGVFEILFGEFVVFNCDGLIIVIKVGYIGGVGYDNMVVQFDVLC